jgi:hypothetical protein
MQTEFKAFTSICTFVWAVWVIAANDIRVAVLEALDCIADAEGMAALVLSVAAPDPVSVPVLCIILACVCNSRASGFTL